jgi:hypothetical protein
LLSCSRGKQNTVCRSQGYTKKRKITNMAASIQKAGKQSGEKGKQIPRSQVQKGGTGLAENL